ncbi:MAG: hypothetical protein N2257_02840 [Thermodesulfovibrionales bacterium]|nr:hypothetical protein [Thermodesulfovibrionales bacterium]
MDIMDIEGRPFAKRGKWSGRKRVLYCRDCGSRKIVPYSELSYTCKCGGIQEELLMPAIDNGRVLINKRSPREIREYVLKQIRELEL